MVKSNSLMLPEVVLACLGYFWFYIVLAFSSLLRLVMGCSTFYKKVKAHNARQKVETLKKVKERKARKKKKTSKARKKRARKARKKRKTRKNQRHEGT